MIAIVASVVCLLAQESATAAQQPSLSAPPLRIGSGDLIEVNIFDDPDLSGRFRVDEKGNVKLPLLGAVRVEGQTAAEAGTTIEREYVAADILNSGNASATVLISEYATQGVFVNGQVKSPGLYPALGIRMLNDLITAAGGILPTATSKVVITRKADPENPITVDYNPEALTPEIPRVQIFPGDTITVPRAGIVYVLGDVNRSGGFVLEGRRALTVEEAMALAGGGGRAAALSRAYLVRTLDDGRKMEVMLSINQIYKGKAPDVALRDGDILYVPTSNRRLAAEQAISSALNIGTSITIYKTAYQ